jgi:hypothetical protein
MTQSPPPGEADGGRALTAAVTEVEDFAAAGGWDAPRRLFALVETAALLAAEPGLAGSIDGASVYTPIAQDDLPEGDLADALAGISWPDEVAGCVLALGILAGAVDDQRGPADPFDETDGPTAPDGHDIVPEGRLVAGVLRDRPDGWCLLRWRTAPEDLLSGAGLAPGLVSALHATFED